MLKKRTFYIALFLSVVFCFLVALAWIRPDLIYSNSNSNSNFSKQDSREFKSADNLQESKSQNYFAIKKVEIEGDTPFVSQSKIKDTLINYVKSNFFDIDMDQTIDALRALPGVKDVSIRRVWPDKLLVVLESETAFARTKNPYWLINPDGLLFESQKN